MCENKRSTPPIVLLLLHLHEHPQRVSVIDFLTLTKLRNIWVKRDERIRLAEVQRVVDAPVDLIRFARENHWSARRGQKERKKRDEKLTSRTLRTGWNRPWHHVSQQDVRTERDAHSLRGLHCMTAPMTCGDASKQFGHTRFIVRCII